MVPKDSRESDGASPFAGHAATPEQTPSPRLPQFVPEEETAVKKILMFLPRQRAPKIFGCAMTSQRHVVYQAVFPMAGTPRGVLLLAIGGCGERPIASRAALACLHPRQLRCAAQTPQRCPERFTTWARQGWHQGRRRVRCVPAPATWCASVGSTYARIAPAMGHTRCLAALENGGNALPATHAHGLQSVARVAPLHFVQ